MWILTSNILLKNKIIEKKYDKADYVQLSEQKQEAD